MSTADSAMNPIPGRPMLRSCCPSSCQRAGTSSGARPRTSGASLSSISRVAASCVYVYPSPTSPSARACTTTIVVESHSSVPSDSGSSVGIVRASTSSCSTATPVATATSLPTGQELEDLLLERLRDHAPGLGVALAQRGDERPCLVGPDVRRQRRHVRVADSVDHERPVGRERLPPRVGDLLGLLDA